MRQTGSLLIRRLLASMVAPKLLGYLRDGEEMRVGSDLRAILSGVRFLFTKNHEYPDSIEEIPFDGPPVDPWGRSYHYEVDEDGPRAWTYGRDGAPGGTGADEDIYWPPRTD